MKKKTIERLIPQWLPFLICALPSLILLVSVPPIFNEIDSATVLTSEPKFVVPHWPPLYPLMLYFVVHLLNLSDAAIYTVLIVQHIISITAAIYLTTAMKGRLPRLLMAVFACIANYFSLFSHGIFTEAFSISFLMLFLGATTRLGLAADTELDSNATKLTFTFFPNAAPHSKEIAITRRTLALAVATIALFFMTASRHNMILFGALLPAMYLIRPLLRVPGKVILALATSIASAVVALLAVHFFNDLVCELLHNESTPLYGRVAVYRVHGLPWNTMPQEERETLINAMLKRCPDGFSKQALHVMIEDNDPWMGSLKRLKEIAPHFGAKTADQAMDSASMAFFLTPNKYLTSAVLSTFKLYLGDMSGWQGGPMQSFFDGCHNSIADYQSGKIKTEPSMLNINSIKSADPNVYKRISTLINPALFDACCNYFWLGLLAIALSAASFARKVSQTALPYCLAIAASAFLYAILSSIVTIFIPRYVAPMNVCCWIMLAVAIISLLNLKAGEGISPEAASEKVPTENG